MSRSARGPPAADTSPNLAPTITADNDADTDGDLSLPVNGVALPDASSALYQTYDFTPVNTVQQATFTADLNGADPHDDRGAGSRR